MPEPETDFPIELIEWIDSMGMGGWHSTENYVDESRKSLTCWTAGFVFHEDKTRLSLALSTNEESFNGSITIPKAAIVKRTKLGPKKRAPKGKR